MNYDKWKKIEVSDDEDDTHPNIDTPSLFRWRHQARVERREQRVQEQQELEQQRQKWAKILFLYLQEIFRCFRLVERRNAFNEKLKKLEAVK